MSRQNVAKPTAAPPQYPSGPAEAKPRIADPPPPIRHNARSGIFCSCCVVKTWVEAYWEVLEACALVPTAPNKITDITTVVIKRKNKALFPLIDILNSSFFESDYIMIIKY